MLRKDLEAAGIPYREDFPARAMEPPSSPVEASGEAEDVILVPYGSTQIRITCFPLADVKHGILSCAIQRRLPQQFLFVVVEIGSPSWQRRTAKRLGLESSLRARGRPKNKKVECPRLSVPVYPKQPEGPILGRMLDSTISVNDNTNHAASRAMDSEWF